VQRGADGVDEPEVAAVQRAPGVGADQEGQEELDAADPGYGGGRDGGAGGGEEGGFVVRLEGAVRGYVAGKGGEEVVVRF
jgi:hypothetical protein